MRSLLIKAISDERGDISSARLLNVLIGFCGCLISWKLVLMGGYNETYFGLLLAYGGGVYGYGKLQDSKKQDTPK